MKHFILASLTLILPLTTFAGKARPASCRVILSKSRNEATLAPILAAKGYELITAKKYEAMMDNYIKAGGYVMMSDGETKNAKTWAELKAHSKNHTGVVANIDNIEGQARIEFGILEIAPPLISDFTQAKGAQMFISDTAIGADGESTLIYNKRLVVPPQAREAAKAAGNKRETEMREQMKNPKNTEAQRMSVWKKYLDDLDAQGELLMFTHLPNCSDLHKQMTLRD